MFQSIAWPRVPHRAGTWLRQVRAVLPGAINERLIQFCGIQRSGNHAVINWIIAQQSLKTCFINGVNPRHNPWFNNWGIAYHNYDYWPRERDRTGALVSKQLLLCSYENQPLNHVFDPSFRLQRYVGGSRRRDSVLLLRDPYNTFASWFKAGWPLSEDTIYLWKQYAREYLGLSQQTPPGTVMIAFNQWFTQADYRQRLADALDLPFTDHGLDRITHHGGGSSFEQQVLQGKASHMKVLERFKGFLDHPDFIQIFRDPDLIDLSEQIFGPIPGTEMLTR
ncbi:hypothetical protein XM38_016650 [Halomicronema hongdechloris C2206]|uniref:Sulfotransferase domain-containing protein n=1 Tax=Halomicronema hongdechloris C2206 TaxID=1641165 RepID=A0A1Z3HK89_9CYAN|nr:hypothetical protein [Halomicronema hongdechloris]ASC70720.1 hypothetical protein XM38_016650 [Halomicronema hongdechloris C2206]